MTLAVACSARRRPARFHGLAPSFSAWRYLQISRADATDYSSPTFDDSAWDSAPAPFGAWETGETTYDAPHDYDPRFAVAFATPWTVYTRLWIRRTVNLSEVPAGGFTLVSFIEDNCHFYVNGVLVLDSPDNPDGGSGLTTHLDASLFQIGTNVIAVRCDDEPPTGGTSVTYADFILDIA